MSFVVAVREYRTAADTTRAWARRHALTCPNCASDDWEVRTDGLPWVECFCQTCRQPFDLDAAADAAAHRNTLLALNSHLAYTDHEETE